MDKELSLFEQNVALALAHDVSGEPRDDHGRWSSSGSTGSRVGDIYNKVALKRFKKKKEKEKSKQGKKKKKEKFNFKNALKAAAKGSTKGAAIGSAAGVSFGLYLKKSGIPVSKRGLAQGATIGAIAGTIGGGAHGLTKYTEEHGTRKQKVGVGVGLLGASYGTSGLIAAKTNRNVKMHEKVMEVLHNNIKSTTDSVKKDKLKRAAAAFSSASYSTRNKLVKELRRIHNIKIGHKSFSQHILHLGRKAVNKFRPYKVIKIAGILK